MLEGGRQFHAGQRADIPFPDALLRSKLAGDLVLVRLGIAHMLNGQMLLTKRLQ